MENRLYLIDLYDIYGSLLTEKQQYYFEEYYFSNLSLSEISDNDDISRNAIYKHIKDSVEKLEKLEQELKTNEKNNKILEFANKLDDKLKEELKELI